MTSHTQPGFETREAMQTWLSQLVHGYTLKFTGRLGNKAYRASKSDDFYLLPL